ncbi:PAS domain S-box protein, partial [bacterium]|nr:PAS domain S-box protein [bacterium]
MRISLSVKVFVLFSTLTAMTLILSTTTYLSNRQNSGATEQVAFLKNFLVQIENMGFLRTKSFYLQKIFYKENFDKNIRKTKDLAEIMGKSYKDYPILIQKKLADIPLLVENFSHSSSELFDYYDIHNQLPKQNTKIFKLLKKRGKTLNDMETHFFYNSINNLLILQMKVYHQHDISNLREIKKLQNEIGSLIQDKATINLFNQVIHNIEMNYLNALEMKKHEAFLIQTSNHFCKVANETISVIVEKNSKRQNIQSWIIFIISAVAICLNILFWILSSRYFQSFIKTHKETIRAIEKGDYPHEFNKTSNDEIGDLSDAMKNMDNSLQKNKERYLKLVNQAPDAIYVVRVDGRIIDVNEQACKSLGYSREALLQMRISEIDPESVDENNKKYLLDRLEIGDNFNSYGTHIKKDNTIFPVEARIGVHYTSEYDSIEGKIDIPEGKIFMAFARNISGRKLAENALSDSEEKYRAMMESMNDEVCISSSDLVIEFLNSAMIKRIGYDATGEKCYKALHGLDEKCSWCSIEKVLEGKSTNYEIVSPKDGKNFNISNTPIFNTDGSVSKLTIFRDLTEFKKIMVQLQQAQKMESIGTLAGGIA